MDIHGQNYEVEVRVKSTFKATHALPSRPELHSHLWEVEFSVAGPINPATGMVCDMLDLSKFFRPFISELDETNLHHFPKFKQAPGLVSLTAKYPTCDTLAHYFLWMTIPKFQAEPRFQGLRITQVKVSIYEPDQRELWGYAVIRPQGE